MIYKDPILFNLIRIQQAFGAGSLKSVKIYTALKESDNLSTLPDKDSLNKIIDTKNAEKILGVSDEKVLKIIDDCNKNSIRIVTAEDSDYPNRLKSITDFPLVLYVKGDLPDIDKLPVIAIVGPRKISDFGKKAAFSLSMRLAKSGIIIASGAAIGADSYAHKGALKAGGKTIAVLGCGICYDYLPQNRQMREDIAKNGCVISEYPP